ncbi:MAG: FlgO family outer membrane protein [Phycisphaerales bacterium]|jgi:hypothetical protein|nr:FlgO family outer membrane protein [Phycisphaerales bacterium]
MIRMKIAIVTAIGLVLCGCASNWQQARGGHWEQGKPGAAGWQVKSGRSAMGAVTVLENGPTTQPLVDANYVKSAYNAISHLLATAHPPIAGEDAFDPRRPLLYATTVDLNNYTQTSNFGRLQAECLATALTQHWLSKVVKMTLRQGTTPIVPREGEYLLSRDVEELAKDYNAGAVMVSTYSVTPDKVYVTVEMINVDYNTVVAAVTYDVPLGPRAIALLTGVEVANGDFLR